MAKNICGIMAAIGTVLVLASAAANAQGWGRGHRMPSHRAPEPLTLLGLGAGVTALFVGRRLTRK